MATPALTIAQAGSYPAVFTVDGTLTDPTDVYFSFAVTDTQGNIIEAKTVWHYGVDAGITKQSTGKYTAKVVPDVAGILEWRWVGTGTCEASLNGSDVIQPAPLALP